MTFACSPPPIQARRPPWTATFPTSACCERRSSISTGCRGNLRPYAMPSGGRLRQLSRRAALARPRLRSREAVPRPCCAEHRRFTPTPSTGPMRASAGCRMPGAPVVGSLAAGVRTWSTQAARRRPAWSSASSWPRIATSPGSPSSAIAGRTTPTTPSRPGGRRWRPAWSAGSSDQRKPSSPCRSRGRSATLGRMAPALVVLNGFDPEDYVGRESNGAVGSPFLEIVYTGGIYPGRRDPTPLFQALALMPEGSRHVRVHFYGTDPEHVLPPCVRGWA